MRTDPTRKEIYMKQTLYWRNRATQIADFSNCCFGSLRPTDIDLFFEYKNRGYLIGDIKFQGVDLKKGQRLLMERLVQDADALGKVAYAIVIENDVLETDQDIDVGSCSVCRYYDYRRLEWIPAGHITVRDFIKRFIWLCNNTTVNWSKE